MSRSSFFLFVRLGIVCTAILLCWNVLPTWAQTGSVGTVNVLVLDPSGGVVQGAKLVLQDLATNDTHNADTQEVGSATFVSLPFGTYRLTVTKNGFQTEILSSVVVQGGRVTDVKVTLRVGAATQEIVVDASATPLMELTSSAIATTIDLKQVEDLPLQGRDVSALAFLTPGFSGTQGGGGTWNGLPLIAQGNTIDGIVSSTSRMKFGGNVQPGLEARLEDIQEMTVQSGQTDLSQGMGLAAMQVNFVTRRGANDYHGRVFEDFRNTVLNANSWFNNAISQPRTPIILNEFGGSAGGHIIRDKLFFFGSFAMAKQPGGYFTSNVILSSLAQQGIYTYTQSVQGGPQAGQTVNLFTQVAQPNGLPTSNAQMAALQTTINGVTSLGSISAGPNGAGDPNLLTLNWLVHSPTTRYYPAFRVDYNVSQKLRIDVSLEDTKQNQPGATAPIFPGSAFANQTGNFESQNYIGSLGLNWTVTPALINQFRGGYYYNAYWYVLGTKPIWLTEPAISSAMCQGNPHFGNCSGQGYNLPVSTFYPIFNVTDNATWIHGVHSVAFGFNFYREQDHYWNAPDGMQNQALGLATGDPALNDFNSYFSSASATDRSEAENLYATLVGRISGISPTGSGFPYLPATKQYATSPGLSYNLNELSKAWALYGQDSFRLNPHLTFNYGLRWDFVGDNHDLTSAYHGVSEADLYGPSGIGNLFKPGTLTGNMNPQYVASSHQYAPWNKTPQPLLGLAWNPNYSSGLLGSLFGGGKTVIRAGFDIRRFTEPYQYFWNNASNHGLAFFQSFSYLAANGGGAGTFTPGSLAVNGNNFDYNLFLKSPTNYAASIPQSTYTWNYFWGAAGFDPHIKQPYVQEWNLGVQRQLGQNNVLEVRYLGHRSVHQWIQVDPNEINIFENGFLKQFQAAQANLKICMATPSCASNPSFGNQGLPGQVPLPIFDAAFFNANNPGVGESGGPGTYSDYTNAAFVTMLNQGAAGLLASQLAYPFGNTNYICNLIGDAISPCGAAGYTALGPYPLNFFQANPLAASFPGVTQSWMTAGGYGNYHALQVDFRQKQWHGMQFDVNYTFSHTLGLSPESNDGSSAQWLGTLNEFSIRNLRQSYGPASFDVRHVIHASGTYDLPFGHGRALANRTGAVDKVVGGWNLGTIVTYQTGLPFQLVGGYNTFNDYGDGGFTLNGITKAQLQNAIGVFTPPQSACPNPPTPCTFSYKDIINPNLLVGTASGTCNSVLVGVCQNTTPGTFGINPWLFGPHTWNTDMSLTKLVPITERVRFNLQAEFLNLFNHPNWTTPGRQPFFTGSTNVQSGGFGQAGLLHFTNLTPNDSARLIELRANITF